MRYWYFAIQGWGSDGKQSQTELYHRSMTGFIEVREAIENSKDFIEKTHGWRPECVHIMNHIEISQKQFEDEEKRSNARHADT